MTMSKMVRRMRVSRSGVVLQWFALASLLTVVTAALWDKRASVKMADPLVSFWSLDIFNLPDDGKRAAVVDAVFVER